MGNISIPETHEYFFEPPMPFYYNGMCGIQRVDTYSK